MRVRLRIGDAWLIACVCPIVVPLLAAAINRAIIGEPWLFVQFLSYASGYVALYFAYRPLWRSLLLASAGLTLIYFTTWWPLAVLHLFLGCALLGECL